MPPLDRTLRRNLENAVKAARRVAERAAAKGLHLAVLWLVLGSVHSVRLLLAGNDADAKSRQAPFTVIDFAVLLIATGHIVSTAGVFHVNGDCRAAVNLTLEWLAIFSAWRLFRTLGQDRLLSNQFLQVFLAIAVGLSVY